MIEMIQKILAKSRIIVWLLIKLRNQCNVIVKFYLNDGMEGETNGEYFIISKIAPKAKFFIDVGANIGQWTTTFANNMEYESCGLVFEPSIIAIPILRKKIDGIKDKNIEIIECAVSDKEGKQYFYMEDNAGETSSLLVT